MKKKKFNQKNENGNFSLTGIDFISNLYLIKKIERLEEERRAKADEGTN